jgi:hypothetical protein
LLFSLRLHLRRHEDFSSFRELDCISYQVH